MSTQHQIPLKDRVVTSFVVRSIILMAWLLVSETYSLPPATLRPAGSRNSASPAGPSVQPGLPLPARVSAVLDSGRIVFILLLYVSAT